MKYSLYSALGLDRNSNPDQNEIKRAYKKMAMEHHPDKNKDNPDAENKFKEISNAYAVLSDEAKKRVYDQVGDEGFDENGGQQNNHPFRGGMGHGDIFEHFFRGGNNPFSQHFGFDFEEFGGSGSGGPKMCQSIHKQLNVSLEEAFQGINKNMTINITKYCHSCLKKCVNCNGSGTVKQIKHMGFMTQVFTGKCDKCTGTGYMVDAKKSCSDCSGNGKYNKEINAHLSLPRGISSGFKTGFPEMGEQPKNPSQKSGDLILEIIINDHPHFKRDSNDLHYKCNLSYIESVIGKDIEIPYFNETIKINTSSFGVVHPNKKYLIEGKGMPIVDSSKMGNMYVEFNIVYPTIKNKDKVAELEALLKETFSI
jgi:DnaJ-class molecular chaperone